MTDSTNRNVQNPPQEAGQLALKTASAFWSSVPGLAGRPTITDPTFVCVAHMSIFILNSQKKIQVNFPMLPKTYESFSAVEAWNQYHPLLTW